MVLLLLADLLAFHDLFEPNTLRDWLMLAGSALAVISLAGGSANLLRTYNQWRSRTDTGARSTNHAIGSSGMRRGQPRPSS